jgi:predicted 2-oxoglutarate/Fe(II)-dependent dioxygenase YbiX
LDKRLVKLIPNYVHLVKQVLTPEECQDWLDRALAVGFDAAPITTLHGPEMRPEIRNNTRVILDDPQAAVWLWQKVSPFVWPLPGWQPISLNERLRYYQYEPGQYFAPHQDGSFVRSLNERSQVTVLLYLNEDFTGGETVVENEVVIPETGMLLLFRHPLVHESKPLLSGRKYVLRSDIMYLRVPRREPLP